MFDSDAIQAPGHLTEIVLDQIPASFANAAAQTCTIEPA
jgi:hypothetical protein